MAYTNYDGEEKQNIFTDKMAVSLAVINQETKIINIYSELLYKIKREYFVDEDALLRYPDYHLCWQKISELYFFIENDKVVDASKKMEKEVEKLRDVMGRYEMEIDVLTWKELIFTFRTMRQIITLSGYHDNFTGGKGFSDSPQRMMGGLD